MNINGIFNSGAEFMDWLANNCYSCKNLGTGKTQNNQHCEFEPILSYGDTNKEIGEKLTKMIIENGELCQCKNFRIAGARQ